MEGGGERDGRKRERGMEKGGDGWEKGGQREGEGRRESEYSELKEGSHA